MIDKYKALTDYAKLANDAYNDKNKDGQVRKNGEKFEGHTVVKAMPDTTSGFQAITYEKDNEIVVAIRGTQTEMSNLTESIKDLVADTNLAVDLNPLKQSKDMVKYINELKSEGKFNNKKVTIAGHSLGGTLAQIAAKMFPNTFDNVYTFNSPSKNTRDTKR